MIKARASGSKVYLYFMKKGRQARHRIPRNFCLSDGQGTVPVTGLVGSIVIWDQCIKEFSSPGKRVCSLLKGFHFQKKQTRGHRCLLL